MAFIHPSEVPTAYLLSPDSDATLLDLEGLYVLLNGMQDSSLGFLAHVRSISAAIVATPTKGAFGTVATLAAQKPPVPVIGNWPTLKGAPSGDGTAALLRTIQQSVNSISSIPAVVHPKFEPITLHKSLREGELLLYVLAGDAKDADAIGKAIASGDEAAIERASNLHGGVFVLLWHPADRNKPVKRILYTGSSSFARVHQALERAAKSLPFLNVAKVTSADVFHAHPVPKATPPPKAPPAAAPAATKTTAQPKSNGKLPNGTAGGPHAANAAKPKSVAAAASSAKAAPKPASPAAAPKATKPAVKPLPLKAPTASRLSKQPTPPTERTTTSAKPATSMGRMSMTAGPRPSSGTAPKKTTPGEAPIKKTTVQPVQGAAISRPSKTATGPATKKADSPKQPVKAAVPGSIVKQTIEDLPPVIIHSEESTDDLDDSVLIIGEYNHKGEPTSNELVAHPYDIVVIPPTPEPPKCDGGHEDEFFVKQPTDGGKSPVAPSSPPAAPTAPEAPASPVPAPPCPDDAPHPTVGIVEPLPRNDVPSPAEPSAPTEPASDGANVPQHPEPSAPSDPKSIEDEIAEGFEKPLVPEPVGEDGLLGCGEEVPKRMQISMDTDDLIAAFDSEKQEASNDVCNAHNDTQRSLVDDFNNLDLNATKHEPHPEPPSAHDNNYSERKISESMLHDAETPFTTALASSIVSETSTAADGSTTTTTTMTTTTTKMTNGDQTANAIADMFDIVTSEAMKEAAGIEKAQTMKTRSSIVENGTGREVKYEEADPAIDQVLESVATQSDQVDKHDHQPSHEHGHSHGQDHGHMDGFIAHDPAHTRMPDLNIQPTQSNPKKIPRFSRPFNFDWVTVPNEGFRTTMDEATANEFFANVRSSNYVLHSTDVPLGVLNAWVDGKKLWMQKDRESHLIPTHESTSVQMLITQRQTDMLAENLHLHPTVDHSTTKVNGGSGEETYHMIKVAL